MIEKKQKTSQKTAKDFFIDRLPIMLGQFQKHRSRHKEYIALHSLEDKYWRDLFYNKGGGDERGSLFG